MPTSPLTPFFAPKSVAVIGATEKPEHVGRTILWNLLSSPFGGTVFPVNPTRPSVLGIKAYPTVSAIPDPVELAVVVTPAPTVPGIIRECAQARIPAAIIISAGFRESGPRGAALEAEVLAEARQARIRIVGPNCLGVMCPITKFNATFAPAIAHPAEFRTSLRNAAVSSDPTGTLVGVLQQALPGMINVPSMFTRIPAIQAVIATALKQF